MELALNRVSHQYVATFKIEFYYDNVTAAMLTLFAVQTTEEWPA